MEKRTCNAYCRHRYNLKLLFFENKDKGKRTFICANDDNCNNMYRCAFVSL